MRSVRLVAALTFVALLAAPARAETFPDHPVRLIIPFAPGGSIDTLGRILTDKLSTLWGQSVFIENRAGAGGTVGSSVAAQAAADGYTIVFGGQFMAANVTIAPSANIDPVKSFAPVILVATGQDALMVPAELAVPFGQGDRRLRQDPSGRADLRVARHRLERPARFDAVQRGHRHHLAARAV